MNAPLRDALPPGVLLVLGNGIVGGMETAVLRLVRALPAPAFRLAAVLPFEGVLADALRDAGVEVAIAPLPDDPSWQALLAAVALLRERRLDLIHAHLANAHALAALAGRVARVPVLATVHAMHVAPRDLEAQRLGRSTLCVVSEAALRHALAVGVPRERLRLLRNAIDADAFAPAEAPRAGPPVVGFVGRLSPEKHPRMFVRVAARMHERCPDARFTVAGDGPLRAALVREAAELGLGDALRFAGEQDDMPAFHRGLDVLVSTSWHEGTPLAVLEAMASGVPVVATAVGGVLELVRPGATGWLVDAGDEAAAATRVAALLADAPLRRRMGEAARTFVRERFGWDAHVRDVTALWAGLAAGARAGGAGRAA